VNIETMQFEDLKDRPQLEARAHKENWPRFRQGELHTLKGVVFRAVRMQGRKLTLQSVRMAEKKPPELAFEVWFTDGTEHRTAAFKHRDDAEAYIGDVCNPELQKYYEIREA